MEEFKKCLNYDVKTLLTLFYLITITGSNAQILSSPFLPHPIENFIIIGSHLSLVIIIGIINGSLGCATQELFDSALRGHPDDSQHYSSSNPGNFQAFLNCRADGDDTKIQQHIVTGKKNATYCLKTIQNKLVKICGIQIKEKIVSEINISSSPVYYALANEATDCRTIEQMPIVSRYVDSNKEINERFIKFVRCVGMTGEALAKI